jgi:pimeloyl-ACP methyl ester carboxylesterase
MNNLTNFYLAGHSFGGYLVGNYALKYHKHIKKLVLLSPVGIRVPVKQLDGYEEFVMKAKQVRAQGGAAPPLYYHAIMKILWRQEMSPFGFIKFVGDKQTKKLLAGYLDRR